MGYMVRLGLWGAGTSFSDFREFLGTVLLLFFLIVNNTFIARDLCFVLNSFPFSFIHKINLLIFLLLDLNSFICLLLQSPVKEICFSS